MIIGEAVFSFFSIYAPQSGLSETELFYDNLQTTVSKMPVSESLIIVGDWNWHVDKLASDYPNVHGGYGYSSCNPDGERILEFAVANKLVVLRFSFGDLLLWFTQNSFD